MKTRKQATARQAFTITEMLVSVAVVLLIMAIVSEAFVAGMDSFRQFKAIGDLDQRLRTVSILLRRDLQADHFNLPPNRLSSYTAPPAEGYFYIKATAMLTDEGPDPDAIRSYRSAATHMLAFTVNWSKKGTGDDDPHLMRLENYLSANVPGTPLAALSPAQFNDGVNYLSQAAEVAYFLTPTGTTTPNGTTLYKLHRRQRLLLPEEDAKVMNNAAVPTTELGKYYDVACLIESGSMHFHTMGEAANVGERVMLPTPAPLGATAGEPVGSDVILQDVISFSVRVLRPTDTDFVDAFSLTGGEYDTATATESINAIEITLRVWDAKTMTTRQITIVQDM